MMTTIVSDIVMVQQKSIRRSAGVANRNHINWLINTFRDNTKGKPENRLFFCCKQQTQTIIVGEEGGDDANNSTSLLKTKGI